MPKPKAKTKTKTKAKAKPSAASALTIEDVVTVAAQAGMQVDIRLVPQEIVSDRPLMNIPPGDWPGDPSCRSVIAAMNVTDKMVEREFKDSPSSQWVITPYAIHSREAFFTGVVRCIKCSQPAAFPHLVKKPYTCSTCQIPVYTNSGSNRG